MFFKAVAVYWAVGGAAQAGASPTAAGVAAKCAPVLSLALLVLLRRVAAPHEAGRAYCARVAAGLALSAVGDALLEWPPFFEAGMAAFAAAHGAYLAAFGRPVARRAPALATVSYGAVAAYLRLLDPPGALAVLVPLYAALLATVAWRGVQRALDGAARPGGRARGAAAAGALLFLASDALLGYGLFGAGPLPHHQVRPPPGRRPPGPRSRLDRIVLTAGAGHVHVLPGPAGHRAERPRGTLGRPVSDLPRPPPPLSLPTRGHSLRFRPSLLYIFL